MSPIVVLAVIIMIALILFWLTRDSFKGTNKFTSTAKKATSKTSKKDSDDVTMQVRELAAAINAWQ